VQDIVPQDIVDSAVEWADGLGYLGLAILSATEAALQPVPPDPLVWSMILDADSGAVVATIVLVATMSSVIGALIGYAIGMYAGGWVLERLVSIPPSLASTFWLSDTASRAFSSPLSLRFHTRL